MTFYVHFVSSDNTCIYCEFMHAVSAKVKFQKNVYVVINISYQKFTVNMLKIMVK